MYIQYSSSRFTAARSLFPVPGELGGMMKAPLRLCLPLCSYSTTVCTLHTPPQSAWGVARVRKKKPGGLELRLHRVNRLLLCSLVWKSAVSTI